MPARLDPISTDSDLAGLWRRQREHIDQLLLRTGGVLLRGFDVPSVAAFQEFARGYGHALLNYEFASTPRSAVSSGVYTSTEYPAHQHIPLHNEQAYTREWPMKIWFHCVTAPASGGETPIADSRAIYRDMPDEVRRRFADGLCYVRNYSEDFDLTWQQVFQTDSRDEVEAYCRRSAIECQWKDDGELRTLQRCQGVERHPVTGEMVWFNQAHLFHASNLQAEVRESLEDMLGADNLPRNVCFADGSAIPDAMLEQVRAVLQSNTVMFPWQAGDILMLDNMLVAHARTPFSGPRKVVVAMAQPHGNLVKA
ncbi:taurine catabolism dioxygenase TauD, TfdA family protein [Janthinobacterium agaricidamnosum NBRC 102515 = DSM 9628]|uniref:Taurine catabolism dioxygenase TauD, TfdA family protein n=1 Tax=Janthinobacterium agaricidamnosum NBRC 102515 = DSM 9628 TaxID=1349767 RepID=W0V0L7_9BURK|nr:taurine catabolism dioxygenase TauD, TfdA family protein [Janthinobacterium agaricidamnosum NBRC 102515 = DSM 9628]